MPKAIIANKYSLFIFICCFQYLYTQTEVSGTLNSDTTWTNTGSPYIIIDDYAIMPGSILTIEQNVTIKSYNDVQIRVMGKIFTESSSVGQNILFDSFNDNETWQGIFLDESQESTIQNCIIKNAEILKKRQKMLILY